MDKQFDRDNCVIVTMDTVEFGLDDDIVIP